MSFGIYNLTILLCTAKSKPGNGLIPESNGDGKLEFPHLNHDLVVDLEILEFFLLFLFFFVLHF